VVVLLETTAGQGTTSATSLPAPRHHRLSAFPDRLGICADTCTARRRLRPRLARGYEATVDELDQLIGLGRLHAWHLNDSKRGLSSRVDRHADLGEGRWVGAVRLAGQRLALGKPGGCLETPAGPEGWAEQLAQLKRMRST